MTADIWATRTGLDRLSDEMAGYHVEARDGAIGVVDRVSYSGSCLYLSVGRFRKRRYVIPAGALARIDPERNSILLDVTKEEIEQAPPYDAHRGFDDDHERATGRYYGELLAKRDSES